MKVRLAVVAASLISLLEPGNDLEESLIRMLMMDSQGPGKVVVDGVHLGLVGG